MTEQTQPEETGRKLRKTVMGVVVGDKNDKTRRVDVVRQSKHPIYGKYLKRRSACYVHDEKNESKVGDTVEIMESRPMSKTKRWRLVRVVRGAASGEQNATSTTATEDQTAEAAAQE